MAVGSAAHWVAAAAPSPPLSAAQHCEHAADRPHAALGAEHLGNAPEIQFSATPAWDGGDPSRADLRAPGARSAARHRRHAGSVKHSYSYP